MDLSKPQKFDRKDCLNWKFIAMITLHFHLHQQFKYELFLYIFHIRNLILAEEKHWSCSSSWGHGKILSKRLIPERLYAVFDEVGRNSVTEYRNTSLGQTGVTNAASPQIKNLRPAHVHSQEAKKKVTSENKVKHAKSNHVFSNFNSLSSFKHNNNLF